MGNSASRRRRNDTDPAPSLYPSLPPPPSPASYLVPHSAAPAPPPVYYPQQSHQPPYYPPYSNAVGAHYYQSSGGGGWYVPPPQISYWHSGPHPTASGPPRPGPVPGWTPPPPPPPPPDPPVMMEQQTTATIRNSVNVKKATIRLEEDPDTPGGSHLVTFSFDATTDGSISIFFFAKEGPSCSLTCVKPNLYKPVKVPFEKGFGQVFRQAPGTGFNLSQIDEKDLDVADGQDEVIPLVIRAETVSEEAPSSDSLPREENIDVVGGPLPKWLNSQITNATIEKKRDGGEFKVRVLSQIIWVDGTRYELQEIYGIESSTTSGGISDDDFGKECVICMSEPRDTTVLPCRHMCMCKGCANIMRHQMDRCPICRQRVEKLLEIKVS